MAPISRLVMLPVRHSIGISQRGSAFCRRPIDSENQTLAPKSSRRLGASSRRAKFQSKVGELLQSDRQMRDFYAGKSDILPDFYRDKIRRHLGALWEALPEGALMHDQNAYLKRQPRLAAE